MANPNPAAARRARRKRPKPGTVKKLTEVLWNAIDKLEAAIEPPVIYSDLEPHEQHKHYAVQVGELTRLVHALSQASGVYLKAIEVGEIEARVVELEKQAEARR